MEKLQVWTINVRAVTNKSKTATCALDEYHEMSSFGEKKAFKLARENPKEYICYTKKRMARTYPAGGRVDSSNYDPTSLWNAGIQLGTHMYEI